MSPQWEEGWVLALKTMLPAAPARSLQKAAEGNCKGGLPLSGLGFKVTLRGKQRRMSAWKSFLFSTDSSPGKPQSSWTGLKSRYRHQFLNPMISHILFSSLRVQLFCSQRGAVLQGQLQEQSWGSLTGRQSSAGLGAQHRMSKERDLTSLQPPQVPFLPKNRDPTENALCSKTHCLHSCL